MRLTGWLASAIAFVAGVASPVLASADSMDPALARLVMDGSCRTKGPDGTGLYYNPQSGYSKCRTDDAAFAKLIAQYGFAVAPTAMHAARTTGYGGFELAIEAAYTKIDSDATYWQLGTQGPQDRISKNFSIKNPEPDSVIQSYTLKIRKGFPFGLEITGAMGYLANTNIVTAGADVRLSLLEGFRKGIPAIFPELAAGGAVRTLVGTEEVQLTVAGVDGQISKPLPIGGVIVLTPYIGYQWIRIFGDSGLVDLTPNTDAVNYCGYKGAATPAIAKQDEDFLKKDANGNPIYDGQPVCGAGSSTFSPSADFNNMAVFDPVRLSRHRLNFGLQLRFQMVKFSTHFLFDLSSAANANTGPDYEYQTTDPTGAPVAVNKFEGVAKQWTLAFDLGAVF